MAASRRRNRTWNRASTLARRIGRPYLEFLGLAHRTSIASVRSSPYALAEERARQTIELARRHGWTDEPAAGIAYISLAAGADLAAAA